MRVLTISRIAFAACLVALSLTCMVVGNLQLASTTHHAKARKNQPAAVKPVSVSQSTTTAPASQPSPPITTYEQHLRERENGEQQPQAQAEPQPLSAEKNPYSLQLNLDVTNQYFFHGILQENAGFILQPAMRLTVNLCEQDDFKIDGILSMWNSFHSERTGARGSPNSDFTDYWYEADLIAGIVITKDKFSLAATYTFFASPSDAFGTVEEIDFTLTYDDTELLGKLALHPYVLLGIETGANGSDGANTNRGTYLELGIAPGLSFDVGKTPVALSFPLTVGLSLDDYYQNAAGEDDTFGFAQIGAKASIPLPFGDRYGKWTLNAGVSLLMLGDHTSDYNNGDDTEVIGTMGLQVNF